MPATALSQPLSLPPLQRARGAAHVVLKAGGALERLAQAGSAKAVVLAGAHPEIVFLNTAGGLTSGDALDYRLEIAANLQASATTQTAERAYRAPSGPGRLGITLRVGAGSRLDWLPQETILFEGADLARDTRIELAEGASCLALEAVVLGRKAMGERVRQLRLEDRREFWRGGHPLQIDPLKIDGAALDHPALLAGTRAFASLVLITQSASDALGPVRAALGHEGVRGAASAWDGRLVIRLFAADGWPLRRQILALMAVLRQGPLPRVWQI